MKTRVLVLTLALLLIVQGAYAIDLPSVTTADLYTVGITKADGTPVPAWLTGIMIPETETSLAVLEDITAAMAGQQSVVSSYFAQQAEDIRAVLPFGTDLDVLQLRELVSFVVTGYTEDLGDLTFTLTFATKFEFGKPVVVMVGLIEGEQVNWFTFAGTVDLMGNVIVTLPQALLVQVQAGNAVIAVLQ